MFMGKLHRSAEMTHEDNLLRLLGLSFPSFSIGSPRSEYISNCENCDYINMKNAPRHKEFFEKISSFLKGRSAKIAVFGSYAKGEEKLKAI
jgi:hypothetical protein